MGFGGNRKGGTSARRVALVIGVALTAVSLGTGCTTTEPAARTASAPAPAPAPKNLSRQDTIIWASGIDPCALIERDKLTALGSISAFGTASSPASCAAHMDDGTDRGVDVRWSIALTPSDFLTTPMGTLKEIEGIQIRQIDSASAVPPEVRGQLVESGCSIDIPFENGIAVRMSVSMARDHNACSTGEGLARAVVAKWPSQPAQGSSPNTAVTVLTQAAPCAVVPELQKTQLVKLDWKDQSLGGCFFNVNGSDVLLLFDYRTREHVTINAQATTFGGRPGYTSTDRGTTFATAIVGNEFTGVEAGRETRLVPVVEMNGDNAAVVSDVMASVLNQLPT